MIIPMLPRLLIVRMKLLNFIWWNASFKYFLMNITYKPWMFCWAPAPSFRWGTIPSIALLLKNPFSYMVQRMLNKLFPVLNDELHFLNVYFDVVVWWAILNVFNSRAYFFIFASLNFMWEWMPFLLGGAREGFLSCSSLPFVFDLFLNNVDTFTLTLVLEVKALLDEVSLYLCIFNQCWESVGTIHQCRTIMNAICKMAWLCIWDMLLILSFSWNQDCYTMIEEVLLS